MKLNIFIFLLVITRLSFAQKTIVGYQYWYDNAYSSNIYVNITPTHNFALTNDFSTSVLTNGLHTFSIRFKDSHGKWTPAIFSLFYKTKSEISPNKIVAYRYWLDSEYSATVVDSLINPSINPLILITDLNLQAMGSGLHHLHIQFKDLNSNWSQVLTHSFYMGPYPIADFTVIDSMICIGGSASFVNQSTNATDYYWDFGDGVVSDQINPTHQYNSYGNYPVSLIASNSNLPGFNDTTIINYFIHANYCDFDISGRVFIEGFYTQNGLMQPTIDPVNYPNLCDTVTLQLAQPFAPYNIVYSTTSFLNTNGNCQFQINNIIPFEKYYIVIKHRNSIEVWSKTPVIINGSLINYDFTK